MSLTIVPSRPAQKYISLVIFLIQIYSSVTKLSLPHWNGKTYNYDHNHKIPLDTVLKRTPQILFSVDWQLWSVWFNRILTEILHTLRFLQKIAILCVLCGVPTCSRNALNKWCHRWKYKRNRSGLDRLAVTQRSALLACPVEINHDTVTQFTVRQQAWNHL